MYHYVYIITNLVNGKQYVGDRSCKCLPEKDPYLGSGKYLKKSQIKYGFKKFKKEILELFETREEAYSSQEKYINNYNTLIPNGYNISPKGGLGVPDSFHHEETKMKIGKAHKGIKKSYVSEFNIQNKRGKSYIEQFGENVACEYKNKISEKSSGNNNPMFKMGFLVSGDKNGMFGKASPRRGKNNTLEHNEKISQSKIGKRRKSKLCPYCNREISDGNYERWHGNNCKLKL